MKEENKFEKNKYQLWEIVKAIKSHSGVLKNRVGFITEMRQFEWNGIWQYSILFEGFDAVQEKLEHELESTGEFLSQKEIDRRLKIISRKPKFDFNEIVEVINHNKAMYINAQGYIDGMSQNYNTGEWKYGISFLQQIKDNYGLSSLTEQNLIAIGEFMPKEETMSNMTLKVTTQGEVTDVTIDNPKTWEDKIIVEKWKDK